MFSSIPEAAWNVRAVSFLVKHGIGGTKASRQLHLYAAISRHHLYTKMEPLYRLHNISITAANSITFPSCSASVGRGHKQIVISCTFPHAFTS